MNKLVNGEKFCQYFFYGLEGQEEIIKGIIEQVAILQKDSLYQEETALIDQNRRSIYEKRKTEIEAFQSKINQEKEKLEDSEEIKIQKKKIYDLEIKFFERKQCIENSIEKKPILLDRQIEEAAKLLVQLKRFVRFNDNPFDKKYVFHSEEEMKQAKEEVRKQLEQMRSTNTATSNLFYIDYAPMSGIFYKDEKPKHEPWVDEVIELLRYLQGLEKDNLFQYYSTFLDVKYARAIHRRQTEQIKDDKEKNEIKNVYRTFLKRKASFSCRH